MHHRIAVTTHGKGLVDITHQVQDAVAASGAVEGLANVFVLHTSASLMIQENADPAVLVDLENFLERLVPEGAPEYTHTQEGPDDMPAHIRSALTLTNLSIPVTKGRLALGTWQGIYLWEHRRRPHQREIIVSMIRA